MAMIQLDLRRHRENPNFVSGIITSLYGADFFGVMVGDLKRHQMSWFSQWDQAVISWRAKVGSQGW
jgi:hypothetical protein